MNKLITFLVTAATTAAFAAPAFAQTALPSAEQHAQPEATLAVPATTQVAQVTTQAAAQNQLPDAMKATKPGRVHARSHATGPMKPRPVGHQAGSVKLHKPHLGLNPTPVSQ